MPVMMIRGGDLDLVEYEFKSFLPGEITKTLGLEKNTLPAAPEKRAK